MGEVSAFNGYQRVCLFSREASVYIILILLPQKSLASEPTLSTEIVLSEKLATSMRESDVFGRLSPKMDWARR
jgi:hypothetical protein